MEELMIKIDHSPELEVKEVNGNNSDQLLPEPPLSPSLSVKSNNGNNESNIDPLNSYRMLESLRKGDEAQILSIWNSYCSKIENEAESSKDYIRNSLSPLHLSVTCASLEINRFVINQLKGIDINLKDNLGNTPLHLASKGGRVDVINLLLSVPGTRDDLINFHGKTPIDLAKTHEIENLIHAKRQEFVNERNLFLDHNLAQPTKANVQAILDFFLTNPRSKLLDINHRHPISGVTCLHHAVSLGDPDIVSQLLKLGANVFARDKRGNTPIDLAKVDKVKELLKEETPSSVVAVDPSKLPRLEGVLKKWTNYASGYKDRWFVLESGFLSYYRSQEDTVNACRGSLNLANVKLWIDSTDPQKFEVTGKDLTKFHLRASLIDEAKMWIVAITQTKEWLQKRPPISANTDNFLLSTPSTVSGLRHEKVEVINNMAVSPGIAPKTSPEGEPKVFRSRSNSIDSLDMEVPPTDEALGITLGSLTTQFDLHDRLLQMLRKNINDQLTQPEDNVALISTLLQSHSSIKSLHSDIVNMYQKREAHWRRMYQKESVQNSLWTESLHNLATEHHAMTEMFKEQHLKIATSDAELKANQFDTTFKSDSQTTNPSNASVYEDDDDDDDEFFDIEDPTQVVEELENNQFIDTYSTTIQDEIHNEEDIEVLGKLGKRAYLKLSYTGYNSDGTTRDNLPKFNAGSQPPAVSLWSVLKNAIGKDLTKITLPVHFNEPSSMLQRMGEDMEYSRLLDLAARQQGDGSERLLWVTAFAMSNYSSTSGRIAKPFNPLLGETFEYVRPDRNYRYISEQVSHHPPISACFCESPNYIFFSEVDVKSNFWGKSYELLPQGVCHVILYTDNGKVSEHYSWKKVTTAVTNLIVGNPTIEHYGDMVVTNHRTKAVCTLTFKPNRWLSNDKNSLEGVLKAKDGEEIWTLSGHWDQNLSAKRVGQVASDVDAVDANNEESNSSSNLSKFLTNPSTCSSVLLWKRAPLPTTPMPFKLTPFALTLNHVTPELLAFLPPTDCRRRPDQRAMEDCAYDLASQEKSRLEDKQRSVRKERELQLQQALQSAPPERHPEIEKELKYKPKWFTREVDPDTNESYWQFSHQYWLQRANILKEDSKDKVWTDVPDIF